MSRHGQWSCEACAASHSYEWGVGHFESPRGWCGVGQHRVATRLEFVPEAEAGQIPNYTPPQFVAAAAGPQTQTAAAGRTEPASPAPRGNQMELF